MRKNLRWHSPFLLCFLGLFLFPFLGLHAQETASVKGLVRDENGRPLSFVSVLAKNTTSGLSSGTQSDSAGVFRFSKLPSSGEYSFTFTYVGYKTEILSGYKLKAGVATSVIIKLKPDAKSLDQIVVVGYGSQRKKDITTAVVSLKAKDLENQPVNNVAEAMVGKMTGVQVSQGSGQPGKALSVKVRGTGTITAGTDPLYVIDGVPTSGSNLNSFNSYDIESIEVLKDASSAAIYGSRGSNGVVLITTKQGKAGKIVVSADTYTGIQNVAKKIDMLDAYQYSNLVLDARNNAYNDQMGATNRTRQAGGLPVLPFSNTDNNALRLTNTGNNTATIIPQEILPYLQGQKGLTNTDWQDALFRSAIIQDHTVSASGGGENVRFYSSLEYLDQDGIVLNSDFKRYGARINVNGNKGIFKFGINLNPSYTVQNVLNTDGAYNANGGGIIASALHSSPIWPVYNPDGSFNFSQNAWSSDTKTTLANGAVVAGNGQTQAWNPVALALLQKDKIAATRIIGNAYTEVQITKDLKYRLTAGYDMMSGKEDMFKPSTIPQSNTAGNPEAVATGSSATNTELNWLLENTLTYNKQVNDHSFNVLLGWTNQKDDQQGNYVYASNGFISNQITTVNGGVVTAGNSTQTQWALASGFGRLQYNYKSKYLLTASMRADGSSRFGANKRWGYFPSASAGWRIKEEDFMKNVAFLSDLKIRGSYGLTGNFNIPNYGALGSLGYNAYVFGGTTSALIKGASPLTQPNPNLSWEKTASMNLGFDAAFFNNKLTLVADYYNSNTNDLLLNVPVPLSTGFSTQLTNIGKLNNKGYEVNMGTQQVFGEFKWGASVNYSANRNKVKELGPGNADIINSGSVGNAYFLTRVGEPIGSYYAPEVIGVFKNQADVNSYPHYIDAPNNYDLATSKPGDFKFLDADRDGKIDFNKDRVILGSYMPKIIYGFSTNLQYKSFDFAAALQGVYGNKILNLSRRYFYNEEGNMNNYIGSLNRFKSEADPGDGQNVRANRTSKGNNGVTSSWHVEDGSYMRIRNLTLGYSLPAALCKTLTLTRARLYITMQNPFTFTKYQGYNPEVSNRSNATTNGEDYGVYPTSKTTSLGLNVTF